MSADPKPVKRYKATSKEWEEIRAHFSGEFCWVCGEPWTELHHILSRGAGRGDDVTTNLAPLCSECHRHVEAREPESRALIRMALMPSNYAYLRYKLGETLDGWIERNYSSGTLYARDSRGRRAAATTNLELNQALDFRSFTNVRRTTTNVRDVA